MGDHFFFKVARICYGPVPTITDEVAASFPVRVEEVLRDLRDGDIAAIGYSQRNFIASGMKRVIESYESGS